MQHWNASLTKGLAALRANLPTWSEHHPLAFIYFVLSVLNEGWGAQDVKAPCGGVTPTASLVSV